MKNFPIHSQCVCLGVIQCFQNSGVWYLRFCRDERIGATYSLAEIAAMLSSGDPQYGMLLAQLGYVVREIETYTNCPLLSLPRFRRSTEGFAQLEQRNPFLTMVRVNGGDKDPWIADFMVDWFKQGRIVFKEVPDYNRFIFTLEDNGDARASVNIEYNSSLMYCAVEAGHTTLESVRATFCRFSASSLSHQSIHNAFIYGENGKQFVCQ